MKLQTQIPLKQQLNTSINYNSKIVLLGSCFSENIGQKFNYYKFQTTINPFGILFHPKAIETAIVNAIQQKVYTENDVFFHHEQWHCFDVHSKLNSVSKTKLLQQLNATINETYDKLKKATHIVITLGTAWVYKHKHTDRIVANCHKISQTEFEKQLLSVPEILVSLKASVKHIHTINPKAILLFTISPVRHIKDGFVENQHSKAHLVSATHQLLQDNNQCVYFPSYEIMMDELRDYRYYAEDMIHPNATAIQYIWEKFKHVWLSAESQKVMTKVETIQKGLAHKPFNIKAEAHQQFLQQLQQQQQQLQQKFSHIVF